VPEIATRAHFIDLFLSEKRWESILSVTHWSQIQIQRCWTNHMTAQDLIQTFLFSEVSLLGYAWNDLVPFVLKKIMIFWIFVIACWPFHENKKAMSDAWISSRDRLKENRYNFQTRIIIRNSPIILRNFGLKWKSCQSANFIFYDNRWNNCISEQPTHVNRLFNDICLFNEFLEWRGTFETLNLVATDLNYTAENQNLLHKTLHWRSFASKTDLLTLNLWTHFNKL